MKVLRCFYVCNQTWLQIMWVKVSGPFGGRQIRLFSYQRTYQKSRTFESLLSRPIGHNLRGVKSSNNKTRSPISKPAEDLVHCDIFFKLGYYPLMKRFKNCSRAVASLASCNLIPDRVFVTSKRSRSNVCLSSQWKVIRFQKLIYTMVGKDSCICCFRFR